MYYYLSWCCGLTGLSWAVPSSGVLGDYGQVVLGLLASSHWWQLTLGICLGSTRVPTYNFSVGLELLTVGPLRRLAFQDAGHRDARLVKSCVGTQHNVISAMFSQSESSEGPPGLKGVKI